MSLCRRRSAPRAFQTPALLLLIGAALVIAAVAFGLAQCGGRRGPARAAGGLPRLVLECPSMIAPGDTFVPVVRRQSLPDGVHVRVIGGGREWNEGESIRLDARGHVTLTAVGQLPSGDVITSNEVTVAVGTMDHADAICAVARVELSSGNDGSLNAFAADVLLAGITEDSEAIDLSTVWVLLFSKGMPIAVDNIYIAGAYPDGGPTFDRTGVQATLDPGGFWVLRFEHQFDPSLNPPPDQIAVVGRTRHEQTGMVRKFMTPRVDLVDDPLAASRIREYVSADAGGVD